MRLRALGVAAILGCLPAAALQSQTGRIEGTVTSAATAAPIAHAEVHIAALDLSTVTDAKGRFLFADVPVGVHEVLVRAVGFQSRVYLDQAVFESPVAILDLRLEPAYAGAGSGRRGSEPMLTLPPGVGLGLAFGYDGLGNTDGAIGYSGAIEGFGRYGFSPALFLRAGVLFSRRRIETAGFPYQLFGTYVEPRYVAQSISPVWAPFVAGQFGLAWERVGSGTMSLKANGTWAGGGGGVAVRLGPQLAAEIGALVGTARFGDYTFRGERAWYECLNTLAPGTTLPASAQGCAESRDIGTVLCYPPFYDPGISISGDCRPPDVPYPESSRSGVWFRFWLGIHFSLRAGG
jgi:hypothetical protein